MSDPLRDNLRPGGQIGLLAIEFVTRRRMRLNGVIESVHMGAGGEPASVPRSGAVTEQVYAHCPKYIQARGSGRLHRTVRPVGGTPDSATLPTRGRRLTASQRGWIEGADTFFIATAHPEHGADASHRGGPPGFVRVENDRRSVCSPTTPGT